VTTRVVTTSGGTGSWAAGMLVARAMEPGDRLVQLFSDTRTEDPDLHRFLAESSPLVGGELVRLD
jgi:hypothetical protein